MSGGLTSDGFLGGRLTIAQPARGFRSGSDAVLLAAAVPARPGEQVLELGTGAGAAALCLLARVSGLAVTGVELSPEMAALARRNAAANGLALEVVEADIARLPAGLRAQSFDHVMTNPPFFDPARGTPPGAAGKALAHAGPLPLVDWLDAAIRRLAPAGRLTLIQRTERLPELLAAVSPRLGGLRVLPIAGRAGRPAERVILHGRKGSRAPFRLLAPIVMHQGRTHIEEGDGFSPAVRAVLRDGAALPADWG